MAFDPDKYLAEKTKGAAMAQPQPQQVSQAQGFNPDKYLAEKTGGSLLDTELPFGTTPRGLIQGTADALPLAGAAAGGYLGLAGGPLAPLTTVGGAALGGATGESFKNAIESNVLGKPKTSGELALGPAKGALEGAGQEMGGQSFSGGAKMVGASKAGKYIAEKAGKAGAKIASTFSGVPEKEIEVYAKNADEINAMAKASDNDSQAMADSLRQKLNTKIQETRKYLNSQISETLKNRSEGSIDPSVAIDELEKQAGKINKKLRPEEVDEIKKVIDKVKTLKDEKTGKVSLQDAHDLKEYLQDIASGSYQQNGQIFQPGDKTARAAKSAASLIRTSVNEVAPEVAEANNKLAKLRSIENVMNKNMLSEGKTAASLYAAGSGGNPANAKTLKRLGDVTGENMLEEAQKLSAARTFGKPSLLPVDTTGKSLTRMGAAGAIGYLGGGLPGALAAEGLASPAAIKAGILGGKAAGKLGRGLINNPSAGGLLLRKGLVDE